MIRRIASTPDHVLQPFLEAKNDAEASSHLERLLQTVDPIILGIVRRRWRAPASRSGAPNRRPGEEVADDVRGDVILQLLAWLAQHKVQPDPPPVTNFRGLVAVTTYHVCDSYLRKRYPRRAALKDKLRYLLSDRTPVRGLALWETGDGERLCGFSTWREAGRRLLRTSQYQQLLGHPQSVAARVVAHQSPAHLPPDELLAALFNWVGGPVELDDLVTIMAELWGVRDEPESHAAEEAEGEGRYENIADPQADVAVTVEQRGYLQQLWTEIGQLSPRQCAALLLNLRDGQGRGVLALLPLQGIATVRQIASALAMPAEQFAALWNDLPIEDAAIAQLLGVTRQQVINLRKAARERLARRMHSFEEKPQFGSRGR